MKLLTRMKTQCDLELWEFLAVARVALSSVIFASTCPTFAITMERVLTMSTILQYSGALLADTPYLAVSSPESTLVRSRRAAQAVTLTVDATD